MRYETRERDMRHDKTEEDGERERERERDGSQTYKK